MDGQLADPRSGRSAPSGASRFAPFAVIPVLRNIAGKRLSMLFRAASSRRKANHLQAEDLCGEGGVNCWMMSDHLGGLGWCLAAWQSPSSRSYSRSPP